VSQHRAPRRRAEHDGVLARAARALPRPSAFLVTGASAVLLAGAGAMNLGAQAQTAPAQAQTAVRTVAMSMPVPRQFPDPGMSPSGQTPSSAKGSAPGSLEPSRDAGHQAGHQAGQQAGHDGLGFHLGRDGRPMAITRNKQRMAAARAHERQLKKAAEQQAAVRNQELAELAALAEKRAKQIAENVWVLPVQNYEISAPFGAGGSLWSADHTGLDFAVAYGSPVVSVGQGVVSEVGYAGAYGNRVIVQHPDGTETWYCHLADFAVRPGQQVAAGTTVGRVGMTGNTTGPHLHLEVRPAPNIPVDPVAAFAAHGIRP
jgi:murein DD-endopeptidase MepM/ murein hydrolase activator NlpD